jgi:glycosyltransferase involved in cell wall biosynthesis
MAPISVLIITHNRHAELRRAIASVAQQTLLPVELIVVDDGSTRPVSSEGLALPDALPLRLIRNAAPARARARTEHRDRRRRGGLDRLPRRRRRIQAAQDRDGCAGARARG